MYTFFRGLDMRDFLSLDDDVQKNHPGTLYNLVANISHEGEPGRFNN